MTSLGIRGQTVASPTLGVTLFGGFNDHFMRLDGFTGRIDNIPARGRTLLFPWDESVFLVVEDCLGRPAMTELSLRAIAEPNTKTAAVLAGDMPAPVDKKWGVESRMIPGLYPTAFSVGGGRITQVELESARDTAGRVEFAPGIFTNNLAVVVDGRVERMVGTAGTAIQLGVDGPGVVGAGSVLWAVSAAGLTTIDHEGTATVAPPPAEPWRPQAVEHDPLQSVLLVASWNRWGSLGGPATDVYVISEAGELINRARFKALVDRMGLESRSVAAVDVTGNVHSSHID